MQEQDLKCGRWISVCFSFTLLAGMITFAVATFVYSKKAREYEAGFTAVESLLTPCEQARDFCLAEQNETQRALVICTTQEQPTPAACPPAPACNEEPLNECRRELNWREQKIDFGEWLVTMQAKADDKIIALRDRYFTLIEEFRPLVTRATEMGIGPRARDWVNKPGAAELYLELGDRWAEIDLIYNQMRDVVHETDSIAQRTCYQNIVWSWGEILPDERDHDRLQQTAYRLTNGDYLVYLYELERVARNRVAEQQP
jgi:hypothetical protein